MNKQLVPKADFEEISILIKKAKQKVFKSVNTTLIDLYWEVGKYISNKIASSEWGDSVVDHLAEYLLNTNPGLRGFSRQNLFRMRQLYETYKDNKNVSPAVRQIHPDADKILKDMYLLEFLELPQSHAEIDLQKLENDKA